MIARDSQGNIIGVGHKCNFDISEEILSKLPKKKIYIDGQEHVMYDLWDRDPEADVWEPLMAKISNVLEEYVNEASDILSESLKENLTHTVISLRSTYTRIWDTYHAIEIENRMQRRFKDYKASEDCKELFEKYHDKFIPVTRELALFIDEVRIRKGLKRMYENTFY